MTNLQVKLVKSLTQKLLPSKHNSDMFIQCCEIVQEGHCWYIKMPSITVFIGHNSETATQYVENLQVNPKHALISLVLDSNEFGIAFLKHSESYLATMSKGIGGAL